MSAYTRFAIYAAPRPSDFARAGAGWLGRDAETGAALPQPALPGLPDAARLTAGPRRYGFHATLRAPFRLADGLTADDLATRTRALAASLAPAACAGLRVAVMDGAVALVPRGDASALNALAAAVVRATDPLRAPLTLAEIARRRPDRLTPRQRALLAAHGYPYVLDAFAFHMTLTDALPDPGPAAAALAAHFAPVLPAPFVVEDLCLFGEAPDGFRLLLRAPLAG